METGAQKLTAETGTQFWQQLLFREAWLLDNNRFEDWLKLLANGIRYYAPVQMNLQEGLPTETLLCHFETLSTVTFATPAICVM